jgi:hypothetical protein
LSFSAIEDVVVDASKWHSVIVQNEPAFLLRLMVALAGNATMALEGNLFELRFPHGVIVGTEETALLKRTARPSKHHLFLVLRLETKFIAPIFEQIEVTEVMSKIYHLHIERNGTMELSTNDRFLYTTTGPGVSAVLLQQLMNAKIISDFRPTSRI